MKCDAELKCDIDR